MSEDVDTYLGPGGHIAGRLPDYEERPEQIELARAISAALSGGRHLLAEAGTGIGKSFAYLLPAVLHATTHPEDGPVVVSTRTIALQEQLERKDLPFLQSVLPIEWSAATAVGRNNYLCLRRMHLARRESGALFPDPEREAELHRVVAWSMTTHDGTRMDLPEPVGDTVWDEVRAEHQNCLNRACPHYQPCTYQRSRRRMESASILVVNHAMYMADVALRRAGVNYLPRHRVVVFDEAHHLERVATESLGLRLTRGTVAWHLKRLRPRRGSRSLIDEHGTTSALLLLEEVRGAADALFTALDRRSEAAPGGQIALGDERLSESLSEALGELSGELVGCAVAITDVDLRMELNARARGLQALALVVENLCRHDQQDSVRWIERGRRGSELRSAPLDVSSCLAEHVFAEPRCCILTSATLGPSRDESFAWLRSRLGIRDADTVRLGSPFDYRHNVQVQLIESMPDPGRDPQGFLRACTERVRDEVLAHGGRALVLCTSWAFVRRLAETLREPLAERGLTLLVQGEASVRQLLDRKRAEPTSVLIGTESLWEGIDVPGEALSLLVLTRLPFAQPDHPLTRARLQAIAERGGNPFTEHSLPEAVLKFRQGFGRLVRSTQDRGRVVILDPRARTRPYGRHFLDALPEGTLEDPRG